MTSDVNFLNASSIRSLIEAFDGKHVGILQEVGATLTRTHLTFQALIQLSQEAKGGSIEVGATWLIKYLLERGGEPADAIGSDIIELLASVYENDSRLHLLQSLPYLSLALSMRSELWPILEHLLATERHKFVRAWTYNALGLVALGDQQRRDSIVQYLQSGLETQSASEKVRIRKVLANL